MMANSEAKIKTTLAAIKNYPLAEGYSDEAITQSINDTWATVISDGLPDTVSEHGHRLLVLHDLLMNSNAQYGGVSRASTKDYTQEMFDWTESDPYLVEYQRLVRRFGRGGWNIAFL